MSQNQVPVPGTFAAPDAGQDLPPQGCRDGGMAETALELALEGVDHLVVVQEGGGKFKGEEPTFGIFSHDNVQLFRVREISDYDDCCTGRACCSPSHKLQLHVSSMLQGKSSSKKEKILVLDRPCKCGGQCCAIADPCRQEVRVHQGWVKRGSEPTPESIIGHVKEPFLGGIFSPQLNIMDRECRTTIATVKAEANMFFIGGEWCGGSTTFTIKNGNGETLGEIIRNEEPVTNSWHNKTKKTNVLRIMPGELDAKTKASMLAALHLLEYMFFDSVSSYDPLNGKCCDFYCCGCVVPCRLSGYGG